MKTYYYKAKSGPHHITEGQIEAENEREAHQKLTRQGLYPILVTDQPKTPAVARAQAADAPKRRKASKARVGVGDLALFTFHLSNLISSGLPLSRALELLSDQIEHPRLSELCLQLYSQIKEGTHFSDALEKHADVFPPLLINTVRAGEAGGTLEDVLKNLSETYEREEETRSKVKQAFIYPSIVLIVAAIMVTVLLIFVVPNLTQMYDDLGQTLPFLTRVIVGISDFLTDFWWMVLGILVLLVLWFRRMVKQESGKRFLYGLLLKVPFFGRITVRSDMASFARILSMLLSSGVGILEALRVTESLLQIPIFVEEIEHVRGEVTRGVALSEALRQKGIFPKFVIQMLAIGEESGSVESALGRVARTYDRDITRNIKVVTTVLEPLLIVIIGFIVAVIIMAMLLPIFQINLIVG